MTEAKQRLTQNQYSEPGPPSSINEKKEIKEMLPENRKPKIVWKIICIMVSCVILVYVIMDYKNEEYHVDEDFRNKNSTDVCYRKVEKVSFSRLISLGLVLFGVCLARLFDGLFTVVEELFQFKSRYNRNIFEVFKQCFSGKEIKIVFAFALVTGLPSIGVKIVTSSFTRADGVLIAGSFGVVRLIVWLLFDLTVQSKADRSRDREKSGRHPIDGIAWSFCVNYLNKVLPIFERLFTDSTMPLQDQEGPSGVSDRDLQAKIPLDLNKMILLFSHDYENVNLHDLDKNIRKIPVNKREDGFEFPVYELSYKGKEYRCVIQYAEDPLKTLKDMCGLITDDEFKEQVKFLYRAVMNIIKEYYCKHQKRCILMLMTEAENLENGGLVGRIMSCVHGQPLETSDVSKANLIELTGRSHVINMSEIEGKVHFNKQVDDESTALLREEELHSASTNDKPLSRKYLTANKSKKSGRKSHALKHSMETTSPRYDPNEKARGTNGEQRISSSLEHIETNDKAKTTPPMFRQAIESPDSQKHSEMKEVDQPPMPRTRDEVIAPGLDHGVQKLKMEKSREERRARENGEEEIRPPPPGERKKLQQHSGDIILVSRKLPAQSNGITVTKDDGISSEENSGEVLSTSRNLSFSDRDFFKDGTYDLDGVEREQRQDKDDKQAESTRAGERSQHTSSDLVAEEKCHLKTIKSEERVDVGDDKATTMQDDVEESEDECQEETEAQRTSVIQFAKRDKKLLEEDVVEL